MEWLSENLVESTSEKEDPSPIHPFDNVEVLDTFERANELLALASKKTQYASLGEQCKVLVHNIYSKLYTLDKAALEEGEKPRDESPYAYRDRIVMAFQTQQELLLAMKVLPFTQYIHALTVPFIFPKVAYRPASWSETPHTKVLPKQFAVLSMTADNFDHIAVGNRIPEELQLGMDPALFEEEDQDAIYHLDENGNLIVEEGMRWMMDFEEAVKVGMGLKIPLSAEEAAQGFDRLLVLGLKETGVERSQELLEELLENHHYAADGLEFVKIGTPSNNTEGESSGYSSEEEELDAMHELELGAASFADDADDPLDFSDGKRVADAFGIKANTLQHIKNAAGREISNAINFNRCLSYATLRDYMEEMMDSLFTHDNIQRTHNFFDENVIGRGALPSFRIGNQPYGILTTSTFLALSRMQILL